MRLQAAQEHAASVSIARSLDALTLPQVVVKGHINVVLEKAERVSPRVRTEGPRLTWTMWKMFPRCELRRSSEAWWHGLYILNRRDTHVTIVSSSKAAAVGG